MIAQVMRRGEVIDPFSRRPTPGGEYLPAGELDVKTVYLTSAMDSTAAGMNDHDVLDLTMLVVSGDVREDDRVTLTDGYPGTYKVVGVPAQWTNAMTGRRFPTQVRLRRAQ